MALADVVGRRPTAAPCRSGSTPTAGRCRPGPGGGLAGTLHPLLAGTGATWVAAAMSEADRRGRRRGPDGRGRPADRHRQPPTPTSTAMAYDVVSNATLWFCHHHLFDLPRRPRFDRHWREAWDAYRAFNRPFADAVAADGPRGRPWCWCRTTTCR